MKQNKKEKLTHEYIKKDLKYHFLHQLLGLIFSAILVVFGFYLFNFIFSFIFGVKKNITIVILVIYVLFFSSLIIYDIVNIIKLLYLSSKNKYEITIDWVVDKLPKQWFPNGTLNAFFYRPYTLVFAKSGNYRIPNYINYKWSDWFSMQDINVYERTSLNNEFYIVCIGKKKNIIAYNKNWFDLLEK